MAPCPKHDALQSTMRLMILAATFALLIAGLLGLWCYRFERLPGTRSLSLEELRVLSPQLPPGAEWTGDLSSSTLRLTVGPNQPRIGVSFPLPDFPPMEALFVRISIAARGLERGPQEWDDGRVMVEWRSPDHLELQETDPIGSLRDSERIDNVSMAARSSTGNSVPVLRIEHLGRSGEFEMAHLELIPIQERGIWKFGRWLLLLLFFFWFWFAVSGRSGIPAWRRVASICIWLSMSVYLAIPGPWKTLRPLIADFRLGEPSVHQVFNHSVKPSSDSSSKALPASRSTEAPSDFGKIPLHGSWIVQLKQKLAMVRPLLHACLLFVPTLVFAVLLGPRLALALSAGLALSIEAAQTAFGFGFDWVDVLDLMTDAIGILGAIWVFGRWLKGRRTIRSFGRKESLETASTKS